ncbi:MAG: efflux transporter outer membrane subunit, partial [Candidatus Latescibacterota bacterium]
EVDVPDDWTAPKAADTLTVEGDTTLWWVALGNEDLDSLVHEALLNNLDIMAAAARVDAAAALAKLAGADLWPQANARFDASKRKQNLIGIPIEGAPPVIPTTVQSFGVSLDVAWEVDLWGRIRSGQSAALADLEASWADLAALRLSIAGQTVKAWFALIEARLQLELAEETVKSFQTSADYVRSRYEQGVRSSLDLRLALSNLYAAEALLEFRRQQLDRLTRQMEILLGRYPSGALSSTGDLPQLDSGIPAGLPSDILLRRPDILAAERRFAAAEKRVSQARRAFFPRITLTGSAGTLTEQLQDLVDGDFSVWSIAAGLTQPIFQGGRLLANLDQTEAASDQVLAQYALSLLNAFGEVESSIVAEELIARREANTADAAEQSAAARMLAERQYAAGIVDYITVLETQRRDLNSQSELLVVRRERLDARVNLHLALGGGFDLNTEWKQFLDKYAEEDQDDSKTEDNR